MKPDTSEDLNKAPSLRSTAIDGLLAQPGVGGPAGGWPDSFLPVRELSSEVRNLALGLSLEDAKA